MRRLHRATATLLAVCVGAVAPAEVRAASVGPEAAPEAEAKAEGESKSKSKSKAKAKANDDAAAAVDGAPGDPAAEEATPAVSGSDGGACRQVSETVTACDEGLLCHEATCMTAERRDAIEAERAQAEAEAAATAEAERKAEAERVAAQKRRQAELRKRYGQWLGAAKTEQDIRVVAIQAELDDINLQMEKPRRTQERTRYTTDKFNKRWALAMTGLGAALFLSGIAVNAFVEDDGVRLGAGVPLFATAGLAFVYPIVFTVGSRRHSEATTTLRGLSTRSTVLRAELVTATAPLPTFEQWSAGR